MLKECLSLELIGKEWESIFFFLFGFVRSLADHWDNRRETSVPVHEGSTISAKINWKNYQMNRWLLSSKSSSSNPWEGRKNLISRVYHILIFKKVHFLTKKCKVHKIWPFHRKKRNRNCSPRSPLLDLLDKDFKSGLTEIIKKKEPNKFFNWKKRAKNKRSAL